jgi:flagellar basal body rod protein FlgG
MEVSMFGLLPALQGLLHSSADFDRAARDVVRSGFPPASDTVDLSTAAVAMLQAKNSFEANTKVVQTADEIAKTTIEMMG